MRRNKILTGAFLAVGVLLALFFLLYPTHTTSVARFYRAIVPSHTVSILFLGDMMFDRDIRRIAEQAGYEAVWGATTTTALQAYDAVIANLEGPVTNEWSVSHRSTVGEPANTTFTFSPEVVASLRANNIVAVTIGNNHILDFGIHGFEKTKMTLRREGIAFAADIEGDTDDDLWTSIQVRNKRLTLVSHNAFLGGGVARVEDVLRHLRDTERPDLIVVYAHWGEEYVREPSRSMRDTAHRFIDAGADLVVGSHPHVTGIRETYHNKKIYYSLGNFIFDQYWDKSVRCGEALEVTLSSEDVSYRTFPAGFNDSSAVLGECT